MVIKLTNEMMKAADFARQLDTDPNYEEVENKGRVFALEMIGGGEARKGYVEELEAEYRLGKRVLEHYTLSYSQRVMRGIKPDVPEDAAGWIEVDSGHIATSEAVRAAIFRPRQKKEGSLLKQYQIVLRHVEGTEPEGPQFLNAAPNVYGTFDYYDDDGNEVYSVEIHELQADWLERQLDQSDAVSYKEI